MVGALERLLGIFYGDEYAAFRISQAYLGGMHMDKSAGKRIAKETLMANTAVRTYIRKGSYISFMSDERLAVYDGVDAPYILKTVELINTPGVTDVHLTEGDNIWYRIYGQMTETDVHVPSEGVMMIASSVFKLGLWDRGNRACSFNGRRLRLRFSRTRQRAQAFVRILPGDIPSAEQTGALDVIKR